MKLTIGLVQLESSLGDKAHNLEKAVTHIYGAALRGANIVCLPETFLTGYNMHVLGSKMWELAEPENGEATKALCAIAKELGIYLIAPIAMTIRGQDQLDNAALFINDDGTLQGIYCKNHVFGGTDGEGKYFATHGRYPIFETKYGVVGVMVCYDANFPEPARILALKGAQIIFVPSAWRIQDKDVWDIVMPARANENTVFLAAVNAWQQTDSLHLFGGSRVINPRGTVIAEAKTEGETLLVQEIDLDDVAEFRKSMPYLRHRYPKTYSDIIEIETE